jgi:phage/plasmid-like protein (TIGR03299 family)
MSEETSNWLNNLTLIGFTEKRGNAWHYRAEDQGDEPNHYVGAIPTEDVHRRLFNWEPAEGTVSSIYATADGRQVITDDERKTMIRPMGTLGAEDNGAILGVFKQGYTAHGYGEWLVGTLETLLGDGLQIGSAGLLKGGAVAWVQAELSENVTTPEGVVFRPFLLAATSLDGSLSSTYQDGEQIVVCDNTMSAALGEEGITRVKVKHSRNSLSAGTQTRIISALGRVESNAETFAAVVKELCSQPVTDAEWSAFTRAHVGLTNETTGRSLTMAENKIADLNNLWNNDLRVSTWKGTKFGVLQAVNTQVHHTGIVRGSNRIQRNTLRMVTGGVDSLDQGTLATLNKVLVSA